MPSLSVGGSRYSITGMLVLIFEESLPKTDTSCFWEAPISWITARVF